MINRFTARMFGNAVRLHIVVGMLLFTPGLQSWVVAQAQADHGGFQAAMDRLETVMSLVSRLQDGLDRTLFDVDALAFELAFEEPEGIRDWLSAHVAYQPYRGVLRGAAGTLLAGAGNSFDQSLLLQQLLAAAGYDTRIVIGQLDQAAAEALLASASVAPSDGTWRDAAARIIRELEEQAGEPGLDHAAIAASLRRLLEPAQADETVLARAEQAATLIDSALAAEGIQLGDTDALVDLQAGAAEHAWVEYRLGEDAQWTPLPTSLPAEAELPAPHTILDGTVPSSHVHRLRISAFAESKEGDAFQVRPVMGAWEMPTAYLNGQVVSYANVPSGLMELGVDADIGAILDASDFFMPYVDDAMAAGALAFDLEGSLLEPLAATDQAAGVFRNVRGGFMSALGALGSLGLSGDAEPDEPLALTRFWLEYTLIAPGEVERVHVRELFDRLGADERARGGTSLQGQSREEAELALMREERLMAITGDYRMEWVLDEFFTRFLNSASFLEYSLALQYGVDTDIELEEAIGAASPLEHLLAAQTFDAAAQGEGIVSWRAEPSLLVFGSGLSGTREDAVAVTSIDIVANARVALEVGDDGPRLAAGASMLHGVWETFVESEIQAAQASEAGASRFSAAESIATALSRGAELQVMRPGDDPRSFGLSGEAALNAGRDLERGYLVVRPDSGQAQEAWWRVRADTGEALGVTFDGRGQTMTEYTIQLYDMGFTLIFAVKGLTDCMDKHARGSPAQACCLMVAHLNNVAGLGMGNIISKGFGAGAGLMLTLGSGIAGPDMIGGATGLSCAAFD